MIEIEIPSTAAEMGAVIEVFGEVWGPDNPVAPLELLVALSHSGGYVGLAVDHTGSARRAVGASIGFLARHRGAPALHSHATGLVPSARGSGIARSLKLHQRTWAVANGLEQITWTFDPLVRRNAWFNIAVLGADVAAYLPSFYGTMTDAINAGDDSDRLLVVWDVHRPVPSTPRDGSDAAGPTDLVTTPPDIVSLRRTDRQAVAGWRTRTRAALSAALDAGRPVLGFTADGDYVIGSSS